MKVITAKEMVWIDRKSAVSAEVLMERAGRGLADFISGYMPGFPVVFICGKGNNGGDGFVAARYLSQRNRQVAVYTTAEKKEIKGLALKQLKRLNLPVRKLDIKELPYMFRRNVITVDCILGTGFKPPLKQSIQNILEIINKNSKITLSCDIPTGVSGDTGEADKFAVDADITVTFEYPKVGHIKGEGEVLTGSLEVVNIGTGIFPDKSTDNFCPDTGRKYLEIIAGQDIRGYFKRRPKKSHKKDYGHIVVVGGSRGLTAAPVMATAGALRAGAGLVTCVVPEGVTGRLNKMPLSAMILPVEETADGTLKASAAGRIIDFIKRKNIDALVIGPGLGVNDDTAEVVEILLRDTECPVLVDADGLNCLSGDLKIIKKRTAPTVLTPHPGEMSRLTKKRTADIQSNRMSAAKDLAAELDCTVILKGYRTVVSDGKRTVLNVTGNPAMAVGGAGDILSGIAGALIGQGFGQGFGQEAGQNLDEFESAKTAVWVHGRAADIAAWKYGERYLNPEEIVKELNRV
jgi:hydroxyethylthiazole kinase-like uncharacterized protein yjeF